MQHSRSGLAVDVSDHIAVEGDIEAMLHCDSAYSTQMLGGAWSNRDFKQCVGGEDLACFVAKANGVVVGYLAVESYKKSFEIHRIAVDTMILRCGIGSMLVHSLKKRLSMKGVREINVEVPEANLRAQLFFKSLGFRARLPLVRTRHGDYYRFCFTFRDLIGGRS